MSNFYKNRVVINSGSGSGWNIKSEENFSIMVGKFDNMSGTYIDIFNNIFFYSDKELNSENVKDFTYKDALEVVLQNISIECFEEQFRKKYNDGIIKGKSIFSNKLRELIEF